MCHLKKAFSERIRPAWRKRVDMRFVPVWAMLQQCVFDSSAKVRRVGAALVYIPAGLMGVTPIRFAWFGIGMALVAACNFLDILASSVFLLLMILMLTHRLLWPLMERPLYAFKRFGVIRQKKVLWAFAVTLMFGPSGWNLLREMLTKIG